MVHHGKNIFEIARKKGYNKSELARLFGKTSSAVDYDMKRDCLNVEVLEKYATILNVNVSDFQIDSENSKEIQINYKEKYFDLLEESKALWQIVAQHGIKVDLRNFNLGGLSSAFGDAYFFIGSTQKATHP